MLAAWILRRCVALALKSMNCILSNVNDHVMPTMIYFVAAVEKEEVAVLGDAAVLAAGLARRGADDAKCVAAVRSALEATPQPSGNLSIQ